MLANNQAAENPHFSAICRILAADPRCLNFCTIGINRSSHDQDFRARSLPMHLLWILRDGQIEVDTGTGWNSLGPGSCIHLPPHCWHRAHMPAPFHIAFLRFELTVPKRAGTIASEALRLHECDATPFTYAQQIARDFRSESEFAVQRQQAWAQLLFSELAAHQNGMHNSQNSAFRPQQLRQLDDFMDRNVQRNVEPRELAELLDFNPAYFTRKFTASMGMAPRRWIVRQRLLHAAQLLVNSDDSIAAIAEQIAYRDQGLFSRQFRKEFGISPRNYRLRAISQ